MNERWITAAQGGLIGAAIALAIVFGIAASGFVPIATDARIRDYMMAHPDLIFEMQAKAQLQQVEAERHDEQTAVDKIGLKKFFDPAVAYVTGPANAKNTFVELFDYNCGHCRNTTPAVRAYYEAHKKDTRFAFINFPIFGEDSTNAARASIAARQQGDLYLPLHFELMGQGKAAIDQAMLAESARKVGLDPVKLAADMFAPETDKAVVGALRLAREARFRGTPVFIVNGKVHDGEITEDEIKKLTGG
jgi:protein-disulfide isomerase